MYICSKERMKDKIETMSIFGDTGNGGITRYALSREDIQARNEFITRMESIGAIIEMDDMANIYCTLAGSDENAKRIVMGSHSDSVKNGGNYDGILGVISAMEVLETIYENNIPHRHPITAMIWTNEEGSIFAPAMMSSGVLCYDYLPEDVKGKFKKEIILQSKSVLDSSVTFEDVLLESGFLGKEVNRLHPERYQCMFETHIEQGPLLEDSGNEIGVVDCVVGMFNYRLKFFGQTTHAGTFPMPKRKDAFYAASLAVTYIHREIDALQIPDLVYTTGEVICHPNVHTCVPDYFEFSFDSRHEDPLILDKVKKIIMSCEQKGFAGCACEVSKAWNRDTVYFDKDLVGYVEESTKKLNVSYQYIHSGAGHDAQFVSYMIPTTMIFVPSKEGFSHCELEYSTLDQCTNGATIMLNAVLMADQDV